jgi:hypothetical protein
MMGVHVAGSGEVVMNEARLGSVVARGRAVLAARVAFELLGMTPKDVLPPVGRRPNDHARRAEVVLRTRRGYSVMHWLLRVRGFAAPHVAAACELACADSVYSGARRYDVALRDDHAEARRYRELVQRLDAAMEEALHGGAGAAEMVCRLGRESYAAEQGQNAQPRTGRRGPQQTKNRADVTGAGGGKGGGDRGRISAEEAAAMDASVGGDEYDDDDGVLVGHGERDEHGVGEGRGEGVRASGGRGGGGGGGVALTDGVVDKEAPRASEGGGGRQREEDEFYDLLPSEYRGPRSRPGSDGTPIVRRYTDRETGRTRWEIDGVEHQPHVALCAMVGHAYLTLMRQVRQGSLIGGGAIENVLFESAPATGKIGEIRNVQVSADLAVPHHARPRGARADDPRYAVHTAGVTTAEVSVAMAELLKKIEEERAGWAAERAGRGGGVQMANRKGRGDRAEGRG